MRIRNMKAKAFTLLELIVVIVILSILAALAIPTFTNVIDRSKDETTLASLAAVSRSVQALSAFGGEGLTGEDFENSVEGMSVAASSAGTYAAKPIVARAYDPAGLIEDIDPKDSSDLVYAIGKDKKTGVVATRSGSGKICLIAFNESSTTSQDCKLGEDKDESVLGPVLDNGEIIELPGLPSTPTEPEEPQEPVVVIPSVPAGLNAVSETGKINVKWNAVTNTTEAPRSGYRLYRQPSTGTVWDESARIYSGTSISFADLQDSGAWCYRVSAYGPAGESAMSPEVCATAVAPIPVAPSSLTGEAANAKATLNWNTSVSEANLLTGYRLYQSGQKVYEGTATTFTATGLTNGTEYSYQVSAYGPGGESTLSRALTLTPNPVPETFVLANPYTPWIVPAGVTQVNVVLNGAAGGGDLGGKGGRVSLTVNVTPGEKLQFRAMGAGGAGGTGYTSEGTLGRRGGDAAALYRNTTRIAAAGGGGGQGGDYFKESNGTGKAGTDGGTLSVNPPSTCVTNGGTGTDGKGILQLQRVGGGGGGGGWCGGTGGNYGTNASGFGGTGGTSYIAPNSNIASSSYQVGVTTNTSATATISY